MEGEEEGPEGGEETGVAEGLDHSSPAPSPPSLFPTSRRRGEPRQAGFGDYVHLRGSFWRWELWHRFEKESRSAGGA